MLDLTKPVRFVKYNYVIRSIYLSCSPKMYLVEFEDNSGILYSQRIAEHEIENIPEPKVATDFLAVYRKDTEDIYLSRAYEGSHLPRARITYTEGAESPWQIEEVKP